MDYNEIAVFIEVVKAGSFSKAAKKLAMPNSTVSSKVSSLEKRLGITLIQRTTRKLNITPLGQAYFKRAIAGLEEVQAAESEIAATQSEPQGLLRVTAPIEMGSSLLPDAISAYMSKYPKVSVELILTDRRVDLLSESVDLAIRGGFLEDSTLIAKKISQVCFVPVASPKYLKGRDLPKHPRDLKSHQCLHFTPFGHEGWKMVGPKGTLHIPVSAKAIVNDLNTLKLLTLKGDGIAFLPTHLCHSEVNSGKLIRVLPEWRSAYNPIHFVYPAQKFVTSKLSSFIELTTDILRKSIGHFEL